MSEYTLKKGPRRKDFNMLHLNSIFIFFTSVTYTRRLNICERFNAATKTFDGQKRLMSHLFGCSTLSEI